MGSRIQQGWVRGTEATLAAVVEFSSGGSCQAARPLLGWGLVTIPLLLWFSAISFFAFGGACFVSSAMRSEFARYGLPGQRRLVGLLQIMGACGLLAGNQLPWLGQLAAAGLALMMLVGVGVRIKIKDTFLQTLPALGYLALNAYLSMTAFQHS